MSSTIKLYEHNQKAYDATPRYAWGARPCLRHQADRNGKVRHHRKDGAGQPRQAGSCCSATQRLHVQRPDGEPCRDFKAGFTPENLQFMTYSAAMMTARRGGGDFRLRRCGCRRVSPLRCGGMGKGVYAHPSMRTRALRWSVSRHSHPILGWREEHGGRDVRRERGLFHGA